MTDLQNSWSSGTRVELQGRSSRSRRGSLIESPSKHHQYLIQKSGISSDQSPPARPHVIQNKNDQNEAEDNNAKQAPLSDTPKQQLNNVKDSGQERNNGKPRVAEKQHPSLPSRPSASPKTRNQHRAPVSQKQGSAITQPQLKDQADNATIQQQVLTPTSKLINAIQKQNAHYEISALADGQKRQEAAIEQIKQNLDEISKITATNEVAEVPQVPRVQIGKPRSGADFGGGIFGTGAPAPSNPPPNDGKNDLGGDGTTGEPGLLGDSIETNPVIITSLIALIIIGCIFLGVAVLALLWKMVAWGSVLAMKNEKLKLEYRKANLERGKQQQQQQQSARPQNIEVGFQVN